MKIKITKKQEKIIIVLFFLSYSIGIFFWGLYTKRDASTVIISNPVSEVIWAISRFYRTEFTPQQIKELNYAAIETITKKLDPASVFLSPSAATNIPRIHSVVEYRVLNENIGYIKIPNFFGIQTYLETRKAMDDFAAKNIKGLMIDLRDNPGGNTAITIQIAGLFIKKGELITIINGRFNGSPAKTRFVSEEGTYSEKPSVVILVNSKSASGSELFSGALKDQKRAVVVGTTTFGKGTGQYSYMLSDGSLLILTSARFFSPNRICPQGIGIAPDINISNPDLQLKKAIEILKQSK